MTKDLKKQTEEYEKKHVIKADAKTKKDVEQLGIAYTPPEIVDFMIKSVSEILKDEFDTEMGSQDVEITDPFTGTGRFITGIIESDQISDEDLERKYKKGEINANEILPESHALAKKNIEAAYKKRMGEDCSFDFIRLIDTFGEYEENFTFKQSQQSDSPSPQDS